MSDSPEVEVPVASVSQVITDRFNEIAGVVHSSVNYSTTVGNVLDRFKDVIKQVVAGLDLSAISKKDFEKLVEAAYDRWIEPIDLPGPDEILDPLLKKISVAFAGRLYDRLSKQS